MNYSNFKLIIHTLVSYSYNETKHFVNGSWDLVSALREIAPFSAKRFVFLFIYVDREQILFCLDTIWVQFE